MEEHFQAALDLDTGMRATPWIARSKAGFALAMHRRGRSSDREHIDGLLDEAMATAVKFGMIGLSASLRRDLN